MSYYKLQKKQKEHYEKFLNKEKVKKETAEKDFQKLMNDIENFKVTKNPIIMVNLKKKYQNLKNRHLVDNDNFIEEYSFCEKLLSK